MAEPVVTPQGRTGLAASYDGLALEVDLPARVPVPSAIAAGEQAVVRRGSTIIEVGATAERGHLVAKPPTRRLHDKVVIDARQAGGATSVRIEVLPFGDEAASRSILDDMLVRLGL